MSKKKEKKKRAAHGLAKEAIKNSIDKIWMEEIPLCISNTIALRRLAFVI
jgi:hypothetical protein